MFGRGSPRINLIQTAASMQKKLSPRSALRKEALPKVPSALKKNPSPKAKHKRDSWNAGIEKGLVDLLLEHRSESYRGQNGWSSESWNRIVSLFHERFPHVMFTKSQIQDKEKELKRDYKVLKEARKQSGVSWNERLCMIEAETPIWSNIIQSFPEASKFQNKPFPLFEALGELHDGQTAEGTWSFTSIQPTQAGITQLDSEQEEQEVEEVGPFDGTSHIQHDEDDENDDLQVPEPPTASSSRATGTSRGKRLPDSRRDKGTKRNKETIVDMMGRFLESKEKQAQAEAVDLEKARARASSDDYPLSTCIQVVESMEELSDDEKASAFDLLKEAQNRTIFMSAKDSTRLVWLRKKLSATFTLI